MNRYQGKVAVVTGGNSGIGLATAKLLKQEGATVVIVGRDPLTLESAATEFGLIAIRADLGRMSEIDRLYPEIADKAGKIDFLFANAGVYKGMPFAEITEANFDEHINVNLKGLFFTVQKALPYLNDGSAIVLNSSVVNAKGWVGLSVYAATKAAVRSLSRSLSAELLERRIRVNTVSPGTTFTPIFDRLGLSDADKQAAVDSVLGMVPLKPFATPEEIAHGVVYLGSSDASYVLGAELTIDGGLGQI